jgi:hypothetical protein
MRTAAEYRQYAIDCIESAREAATELIREQYLDLAVLWLKAATQIAKQPGLPLHLDRIDGYPPPGSDSGI